MDIVQFPIGSLGSADVSLSGGSLVLTVKVSAQAEIDALLSSLATKDAALAPFIAIIKAGLDSAMS